MADEGLLGTAPACPASSCLTVLQDNSAATDGLWWLDVRGVPTELECDMSTDGGGWTLVFSDDFEGTPDAGWNLATVTSCGAWGNILGGYNVIANGTLANTVDLLGIGHTEARVEAAYIKLDSWDGERAWIAADAVDLWSQSLYYHEGAEVCGWNRGWNGSYDQRYPVSVIAAHTAASLAFEAGSALNQTPDDESFGVDDVDIWVR